MGGFSGEYATCNRRGSDSQTPWSRWPDHSSMETLFCGATDKLVSVWSNDSPALPLTLSGIHWKLLVTSPDPRSAYFQS